MLEAFNEASQEVRDPRVDFARARSLELSLQQSGLNATVEVAPDGTLNVTIE